MKGFNVINEGFACENCGEANPKSEGTCRNHCRKCLYSMHVDDKFPGDRASKCNSLMMPVSAHQDGKKGWMIIHKCLKCDKEIPNKKANDDNFDEIINLETAEKRWIARKRGACDRAVRACTARRKRRS